MALNLYRRRKCMGGRDEESRSGEFEERKKGWNLAPAPYLHLRQEHLRASSAARPPANGNGLLPKQ